MYKSFRRKICLITGITGLGTYEGFRFHRWLEDHNNKEFKPTTLNLIQLIHQTLRESIYTLPDTFRFSLNQLFSSKFVKYISDVYKCLLYTNLTLHKLFHNTNFYPSLTQCEGSIFERPISHSLVNFQDGFSKLFNIIRPTIVIIYRKHYEERSNSYTMKLLGTGLIFKPDGSIITAAHLFTDAEISSDILSINLSDGTSLDCSIIGIKADIALLKIKDIPDNFSYTPPSFANARPNLGEFIATYGASEHGDKSIGVMGIVSQPLQSFQRIGEKHLCRYVQLSMITLPGMSGSPIYNTSGEVVAILVKKYEDYGLALPSRFVLDVIKSLEKYKKWSPFSLGIQIIPTTHNGIDRLMVSLVQNSGPNTSNLLCGDIILKIEGNDINTIFDIYENMSNLPPTSNCVSSVILRDNEIMTINLKYTCKI